jgi:hypothetical protein
MFFKFNLFQHLIKNHSIQRLIFCSMIAADIGVVNDPSRVSIAYVTLLADVMNSNLKFPLFTYKLCWCDH